VKSEERKDKNEELKQKKPNLAAWIY